MKTIPRLIIWIAALIQWWQEACEAAKWGARWPGRGSPAGIKLEDGTIHQAEVPWYEAHGIGKRWMKIKRYID